MNSTATTPLEATSIRRIAFFGTPQFAVPTLDALRAADRTPVVVVSQPTRGVGRGRRRQPPPVAAWAEEHDVELIQTSNVRDPDVMAALRGMGLDLAIVVAFGQIFRQELLDLPRLGCMNLHASLLPAYRGASPIVAAIREGETETGACTMMMERGLDSGPVLLCAGCAIESDETSGELTPRLAELGAQLAVRTLDTWERGDLTATPQDDDQATFAPMLDRSEGWIDWSRSARRTHDLVRAFDPWPGTRTRLGEDTITVKKTRRPTSEAVHPESAPPGTVVALSDDGFLVSAGDGGLIELLEVQRAGRRAVSGRAFANGEGNLLGRRFESGAPESTDG